MRVARGGRWVFALTMAGIGLWGLLTGGSAGVWESAPRGWPARDMIAHLVAVVSLVAGAGLLWRRTAAPAAGLLLAALLAWMAAVKAEPILAAPASAVAWESWGETAVLAAAAWALFADFASSRGPLELVTSEAGLRIARALYGGAMIAFGVAHFAYAAQTAALVPRWLPAHPAWVTLTGWDYVAAGVAILAGVFAGPAAALSALQMGVFTLLVWAPVVLAGGGDASQRSEAILSWALAAAGWAMADSYRGSSERRGGGRVRRLSR